jgi:hypothetical protein
VVTDEEWVAELRANLRKCPHCLALILDEDYSPHLLSHRPPEHVHDWFPAPLSSELLCRCGAIKPME